MSFKQDASYQAITQLLNSTHLTTKVNGVAASLAIFAYLIHKCGVIELWLPVVMMVIAALSVVSYLVAVGIKHRSYKGRALTLSAFAGQTVMFAFLLWGPLGIDDLPNFDVGTQSLRIEVKNDGASFIKKTLIFEPNDALQQIEHYGVNAETPLTYSDFKWSIQSLDAAANDGRGSDKSYRILWEESDFCPEKELYTTRFDRPLVPGEIYRLCCSLTVSDIFPLAKDSDWCGAQVCYPADSLSVEVHFDGDRPIVEQSARITQALDQGKPDHSPAMIPAVIGKRVISWSKKDVKPGDLYMVSWIYQRP